MGGQPVIQGGMNAAQYQQIINDQMARADAADRAREDRVREYEKQRAADEKTALQEQKALEQMTITQQKEAEAAIADEIKAQQAREASLVGEMPTLGSNFVSSLYKGLTSETDRYRNG